jgi:hypothetical protein
MRQWEGWCAGAIPRGLIYPSLGDLLCGLWLQGSRPLWMKPNRTSTAFSLPSIRTSLRRPKTIPLAQL